MGRTPKEDIRIAYRRTRVLELYKKDCTQAAIAHKLDVSQATVSSDLKAIHQELRESRICDLDELKNEMCKKLEALMVEYSSVTALKSSQPAIHLHSTSPMPSLRRTDSLLRPLRARSRSRRIFSTSCRLTAGVAS